MPTPLNRVSLVTPLLALCVALSGCSGTGSPEPDPDPDTALTTPLDGVDTTALGVQRAPFCDLVPEDDRAEALGEVTDTEEWSDGDRLEEVGDRVQEYGCRWVGERATASAWVMAPPVTAAQARRIAGSPRDQGCRPLPDAAAYGDPSRSWECDGGERYRHAGLFGDAWLTCELGGEEVTADLSGRWCVAVAQAASS